MPLGAVMRDHLAGHAGEAAPGEDLLVLGGPAFPFQCHLLARGAVGAVGLEAMQPLVERVFGEGDGMFGLREAEGADAVEAAAAMLAEPLQHRIHLGLLVDHPVAAPDDLRGMGEGSLDLFRRVVARRAAIGDARRTGRTTGGGSGSGIVGHGRPHRARTKARSSACDRNRVTPKTREPQRLHTRPASSSVRRSPGRAFSAAAVTTTRRMQRSHSMPMGCGAVATS